MAWLVNNSQEAEAAGAHPEWDRLLLAVTPAEIVQIYNRYRNPQTEEGDPNFVDHWDHLTPKRQAEMLKCVERQLERKFQYLDETINDALVQAEREP